MFRCALYVFYTNVATILIKYHPYLYAALNSVSNKYIIDIFRRHYIGFTLFINEHIGFR